MFLTSIQGKLCVSTPCFIFYVNSLHATWTLRQVPHIELMVALMPTIPQFNPLLSSIFISALTMPSYDVPMVTPT
ncbi:hypothetical protein B296_00010449 [Ensete ventricosum]|uniref:Uncharacterized protein n=1 Tax=Ensete ventricosum TaxID=4639 RepID=A0A427B413_ENSVE|nr:hypothetical protein B296_00010449 [Ensete ventricosum]